MSDQSSSPSSYLELNDEVLLENLGRSISGQGDRSGIPVKDLVARGMRWMAINEVRLKQLICSSNDLWTMEGAAQVAAVADLIADLLKKPAAFTVAAILVKKGLDRYCERTS